VARIIGIINQKGGVGKTTSSLNIAAYLAALGKYVLLVDLDPQANSTSGVGVKMEDDHPHIYHAMVDGIHPRAAIKKSPLFGLDIMPSGESLAGANIELVGVQNREYKLREALEAVRIQYDYILIDSPPSLGLLTVNGLAASEEIIIPVQCEYYALEGLSQLIKTVDLVKTSLNSELKIMGVLLTMYDKRNRLDRQVVKEVKRNFPGRVFDAVIPRSISLAEAPSFGQTILQFDPGSKAAKSYRRLAEEIISLS